MAGLPSGLPFAPGGGGLTPSGHLTVTAADTVVVGADFATRPFGHGSRTSADTVTFGGDTAVRSGLHRNKESNDTVTVGTDTTSRSTFHMVPIVWLPVVASQVFSNRVAALVIPTIECELLVPVPIGATLDA